MESWAGHLPITTKVLLSLFDRAAVGGCDFSQDERALYSACEFWAAAVANELSGHLGSDPVASLQVAGVAFLKIGANSVMESVLKALDELRGPRVAKNHDEWVAKLERSVRMTRDPVDLLIAQFAARCAAPAARNRRPVLRLESRPSNSL